MFHGKDWGCYVTGHSKVFSEKKGFENDLNIVAKNLN